MREIVVASLTAGKVRSRRVSFNTCRMRSKGGWLT